MEAHGQFSPRLNQIMSLSCAGKVREGVFLILFLLVDPKCGGSHIFEKISTILLMFELMPNNVVCKSKVSSGEGCVFGRLSVCSAPSGFESDSLPNGLPSISSVFSIHRLGGHSRHVVPPCWEQNVQKFILITGS